jgi:hypothetical protein
MLQGNESLFKCSVLLGSHVANQYVYTRTFAEGTCRGMTVLLLLWFNCQVLIFVIGTQRD